jgi:HPt (histidine-containing phosphotransfer) domain-containing protein
VYRRSLGSFVRDLGAIDSALAEPAILENTVAAARELHTLKGVAATLGVTRLATVASDGERLLKDAPTSRQAAAVLTQVRATITEARSALAALFEALDDGLQNAQAPASAIDPTPQSPEDRAALMDALVSLKHMLADSDMGAIEALAGLRAKFPAALGPALQLLDQAIGELDFETALRHCNHLLSACHAQGIPS